MTGRRSALALALVTFCVVSVTGCGGAVSGSATAAGGTSAAGGASALPQSAQTADAPERSTGTKSAASASAPMTEVEDTAEVAEASEVADVAEATEVTELPQADVAEVTAAPEPVALDPLDDLDEDGTADEYCGTIDLGAGLIVRTVCNTSLVPGLEGGIIPTANSLLLLPSPPRWEDLVDVDAGVRVTTAPDGRRVVIYILGSDTLFENGQSGIKSAAQPPIQAIVASINARFPDKPILVRGATGLGATDAATLSAARGTAVAQSLVALGIEPGRVTSIGIGSDFPIAQESNSDGTPSEIGQQVNRRVEIVVG